MPISDDDKKLYKDFAIEIAFDLGSVGSASIPPDTILWHYTTGIALIGILDSMTIFSTHLSCLNDTSELRYATRLFQDALTNLRMAMIEDKAAFEMIDGALGYFKEDPNFPAQATVPHYVACFSEQRDDLSQWRAYGGGENGYALGFRAGDLRGIPRSALARVSYDNGLHCALARRTAESMVKFFFEGLRKYSPADPADWTKEFFEVWEKTITMVAPMTKDSAFANERECRIIRGFVADDFPSLKFFQKATMISRHIPLRPPAAGASSPYRLPIAEIIVGPCRHPQISRTSVDTLLRQKGYPTSLVTISKIPFQVT
jgi:hypothetical protein